MAWHTDQMCEIAAQIEITHGQFINLGIGMPTIVDYPDTDCTAKKKEIALWRSSI